MDFFGDVIRGVIQNQWDFESDFLTSRLLSMVVCNRKPKVRVVRVLIVNRNIDVNNGCLKKNHKQSSFVLPRGYTNCVCDKHRI